MVTTGCWTGSTGLFAVNETDPMRCDGTDPPAREVLRRVVEAAAIKLALPYPDRLGGKDGDHPP